jgi:hypothetical protein
MDAYDRGTNLKKNLADIIAIYGRGRELFRPPTYVPCWWSWINGGNTNTLYAQNKAHLEVGLNTDENKTTFTSRQHTAEHTTEIMLKYFKNTFNLKCLGTIKTS